MGAIPVFKPYEELYGFDETVKPHWQMVPLNGEKKVYLLNAEGMTLKIVNPNIAQFSEDVSDAAPGAQKKRLLTIKGNLHGRTYLEVWEKHILKTRLEIAVKNPKVVKLAFNFVTDKTGRTTEKVPASVPVFMNFLDQIYEPQTNVTFIQTSVRNIFINNDLGPDIDYEDAKGSEWEWKAIVSQRDNSAYVNIFFVWKVIITPTPGGTLYPKGETSKQDCFIRDYPFTLEQWSHVIAHEIGHALGIPSYMHYYNLKTGTPYVMFYSTMIPGRFPGAKFAKKHINIINK